MIRIPFFFLPLVIGTAAALGFGTSLAAQDTELTNHQCGISVTWGVGDGSDKGTAYMEEYNFHDKLLFDQKQVWIKSTTAINMAHNANNVGLRSGSGRNLNILGSHGPDGAPNTGDEGKIRYVVDELWREKSWTIGKSGSTPTYTAYAAPFTLATRTFDTGHGVVGATGEHPTYPITDETNFYWRGLVDSAGDEWHILRYADDDGQNTGVDQDDMAASDGKAVALCVNPKTPAMTVRAAGDGQFYTTPAWAYYIPKIHDQTTYFQVSTGSVTFELRNIYGAAISYSINGGSTVNVGAASITLTAANFTNGSNTLQYWYTATPATKRTRTIIKNPPFPSANEAHGNRAWGDARWAAFTANASRAPYDGLVFNAKLRGDQMNRNAQGVWDGLRRQGKRLGATNCWPEIQRNGRALPNAIMAKYLGFNAVAEGAIKSYAAYAKEMILESSLNNSYMGRENGGNVALPCADTSYRGYWDVDAVYNIAIAYDALMNGYRSDQQPGGITPIEDFFVRDRLAEWVFATIGQKAGMSGMWGNARGVGATLITAIMPSYSTPYYGTSGVDGNTTVYPWAPFRTTNVTWKKLWMEHDTTLGAFPDAPSEPFEFLHGMTSIYQGHIIAPANFTMEDGHVRCWRDRLPYAEWSMMGHSIGLYAILWKLHFPEVDRPDLVNFIDQITAGRLYGSKMSSPSEWTDPARDPFIFCLNSDFPQAVTNARDWIKNAGTENDTLWGAGILAAIYYEDGRVTPAVAPSAARAFFR